MNDRTRHRRLRPARPTPELLEDRRLPAALAPIANVSVPSQQGYELPLDGSAAGDNQTFSITQTSGSPDISASIAQGPFWTINVQYTDPTNSSNSFSGALVFQLFSQLTPNTVGEIQAFMNSSYFTNKEFTRIATGFPGATDYILQGGTTESNEEGASGVTGTPFLNENAQQLAFTGSYQLAMANAGINPGRPNYTQGVNTNDSQFFITTGSPDQVLGYGYTIFGQMIAGQDVIAKMTQIPRVDDPNLDSPGQPKSITRPANPLVMTSLSLSTTNPSGVAIIDTSQARPGDTATFQVTATDATGSVSQSFTVTAGSYSTGNGLPLSAPSTYFKPFANAATATVAEGSSTTVTATGTAGYPYTSLQGTLSYSLFAQPSNGMVTNFNASTGTFTYTPNPGYSGTDSVQVKVNEVGETPFLGYLPNTTNPIFGAASTATTAATTSNPATVTITVTPTPTPTSPTSPPSPPASPPSPPASPPSPPASPPSPPASPPTTPTSPAPTPPPLVTVTGVVDVTNKKHQVTAIHVTFSGALNPAEAADAATYQLIKQGKHKAFVVSRKSTIAIASASYDPTDNQVTLIPAKPFALSKPVEVLISGQPPSGLQDAEGRLIDGNRDGQPGGNVSSILSKGGASVVAMVTAAPSLAVADAVDDLVAQSSADALVQSQAVAWLSPHDKARRH